LYGAEQASTRRTYGRVLRWVVAEFGADTGPGEVDPERFAGWFTARWADRAPSTWNVSLDAVRSAAAYWQRQGWLTADPLRMLERRKPRPDRARALSRAKVEQLLTREDMNLRERTLWRLLYETAARSAELLALDVEDLDLPNRRARVRRKGGAIDVIIWQTGTARLLPRLLKGRTAGPVFVTAQGPGAAARRRSRPLRPRPAVLPAGCRPVLPGLRRRDAAPAPPFRADARRGSRHRNAHADGPLRSHRPGH
jgi:integrase